MSILERLRRLRLNPNKATGLPSPHKPAMLLAVIDAVEAQSLPENRIEYDEVLLERFQGYFDLVRTEHDHPRAYYPFFHLRREGFWIHVPRPDREAVLGAMSTARKASDITDNIEHVRLDEDLFERMKNPSARRELRATLIQEYFPDQADKVWRHVAFENGVAGYQKRIERIPAADRAAEGVTEYAPEARDTAFRRVVVPAYDYRCAACGLRLVFNGSAIVEACHLVPWEVSHDDDPRNGMALCRNHHWALDQWLIAPAPDLKWRASPALDKRIDGQRQLRDLDGEEVIKPVKPAYAPRADALEYRFARLMAS